MEPREFRDIAGTFATGVTVVTAMNTEGKPIGMTVNSFTSLSLDPPLVLVTVDLKTSLYDDFMTTKAFAVNILSADEQDVSMTFASKGVDRFEHVTYHTDVTNSPVLDGGIGYFDCEVYDRIACGDHVMVVGKVVGGQTQDGAPLLFFRGKYKV